MASEGDTPDSLAAFPGLEALQRELNIKSLYPPQQQALELTAEGDSLVLALATAAGKSLVAYANLWRTVHQGGKGLYIVPLRALGAEKYRELKELAGELEPGWRVGLTMGDYDAPARALGRYDLLVATSEKVDSLLRANPAWLSGLRCVVADEVHLLNSRQRGPALEVTLTRLKSMEQRPQVLALSATVGNSLELASWLGARHLASSWRPVELRKGLCHAHQVHLHRGKTRQLGKGPELVQLIKETLGQEGQLLIFVASRRNAEAQARRLERGVANMLSKDSREWLEERAAELEQGQGEPSLTTRTVAESLRSGVAFHHAGLGGLHREALEEAYRARHLKVIVATPTLAAGVNLPAQRVVIRDLKRYDIELGFPTPLPVLEVEQMMGRAGRPGYDKLGEAVLMVKDARGAQEAKERYLEGEVEPILSKLGSQAALRVHLLAAIDTGHCHDREGLREFLAGTFYGHQEELWRLKDRVDQVLDFLDQEELIHRQGGSAAGGEFTSAVALTRPEGFQATPFGHRICQLYLDPLSGVRLRKALQRVDATHVLGDRTRQGLELGLLHAICTTPDMNTLFARQKERYDLLEQLYDHEEHLLVEPPVEGHALDEYLGQFKTALLLRAWACEASEDELVTGFGVGPGDIHHLKETADWLLHALGRLAELEAPGLVPLLEELRLRVAHGIRDELLELIDLEGVGRVRARTLHQAGYTTLSELAEAKEQELARLSGLGKTLAKRLLRQARRAG